MFLLLIAGGGCEQPDSPTLNTGGPAPADPPAQDVQHPGAGSLELEVHRYSAPAGSFSESIQLWQLADGPLRRADETLHLRDNGVRAGVGCKEDRAALEAFLSGVKGLRVRTDRAAPDPRRPVELTLDPHPGLRTVMYVDRLGNLEGVNVENAASRWMVGIQADWKQAADVELTLAPELQEPPGTPDWVMTEHGPVQRPSLRIRRFPGMAIAARVPPDGFLLIGADRGAFETPSLGRAMFEEPPVKRPEESEAESAARECILILIPQRNQTQIRSKK